MAFYYTDPKHSENKYALPDVEVWEEQAAEISCRCGEYEVPSGSLDSGAFCPSCEKPVPAADVKLGESRWWFAFGFPGCLSESSPYGGYPTEKAALEAAREIAGVDDAEDEES